MKACNHERILSSDLQTEVDASLNIVAEKLWLHIAYQNHTNGIICDSLVFNLQDSETETLKLHYIHEYKVFG